jgi:signal transduction histidine kinase
MTTERLQDLGLTVGMIAHELNNPLALITSNLAFVRQAVEKMPAEEAKEVQEALDDALLGASEIRDLVATLLMGQGCTENTAVDLGAQLHRVYRLATGLARRRGIALALDVPAVLPPVRGVRCRLLEVLINLTMNALQATEQGGEVLLRGSAEGTEVRLDISDTGRGIAPEVRDRLFQAQVTTRPDGHGLGLVICHEIVASHGGRLAAKSSPAGTTMTVWLPAMT